MPSSARIYVSSQNLYLKGGGGMSDKSDDDGGYQPSRTDTDELAVAIKNFEVLLPGWWWSVCHCALTRDASCGPDARVLGVGHPHVQMFDAGFHEDHEGTLADALRSVTNMAMDAVKAAEATNDG